MTSVAYSVISKSLKIQRKTPVSEATFNKFAGVSATLLKKRHDAGAFLWVSRIFKEWLLCRTPLVAPLCIPFLIVKLQWNCGDALDLCEMLPEVQLLFEESISADSLRNFS